MTDQHSPYSIREILGFYLPLFLNQGVITLTAPFLNYGVSRSVAPETALAAFGAAFSLTIIFNSIVFTSLRVYNSLLKNRNSFNTILKVYTGLAVAAGIIFAGMAVTELGDILFAALFNLSQTAIFHAKDWMLWVIPVPFLVAVRCALQGVTTVYRNTVNTALGTALRMVTALAAVLTMISLFPHRPGMASASAFSLAIAAEVAFLIFRTRKMLGFSSPTFVAAYEFELTIPYVFRYSLPLWISSLAWTCSYPMINYFIGRTANAEAGLAGFSILRSLNVCLNSPLNSMVTVVVILGNRLTLPRLRGMSILLAGGLTLVNGVLVFSPLGELLLSDVFSLSGKTLAWSQRALVFFMVTPVLFLTRFFIEGLLMRKKRPGAMGLAGGVRLSLLFIAGFLFLKSFPGINGAILGMAMMTVAGTSDAVVTAMAFKYGENPRA